MKKQLLSLLFIAFGFMAHAQYDYSPVGRHDAPTLGMQWGLTGGGFTSMLNNRDDIAADDRLNPQTMNFSYCGGVEGIYWFQHTIGFGAQLLFWNGGAKYTGLDTFSKISLDAQTKMTYFKLPLLFHFKSYNRYYPNRRTRFSAFFGPYVALLTSYSDELTYTDKDGKTIGGASVTGKDFQSTDLNGKPVLKGTITGNIYNPLDLGFVVGIGAEVRLWTRTTIALHIRADIGASNVENTKGMKIKYTDKFNGPYDITKDYDYNYWSGDYAKFVGPGYPETLNGWAPNRPATKNFSVGAFLSIRKYF